MGNECCSSTSNKLYQKQLGQINLHELKSQWSAINSYKIKRIFQRLANKQQTNKLQLRITLDAFCEMFPQFIRYEEVQKKRIYQIFDRSNNGYVDWNDFYDSISLCYFASQKVISILMFMIFDQLLQKQLDKQSLTLLVDLNAAYLKDPSINGSQQYIEPEQVIQNLLGGHNTISLEQWIDKSDQYFDFNQFRRMFNIFKEQKLEKQLVQNFNEWNEIYDQKQNKYITYIISFKWFEAWKIYVQNEYGIYFSIQEKNPATMKSIKTKKSLKTNNSGKSKRHYEPYHTMRKIKFDSSMTTNQNQSNNMSSHINMNNNIIGNNSGNGKKISLGQNLEEVKNYDMIRSIIGERPKEIYNKFLQGEYAGTFRAGLVENRDYVFVSEKVWEHLTQIYSGEPEFRRTGFDQIELYPKIVRIYSGMFKGQIDYSSEIVRQVSNSRTVQQLLTKSLQINAEDTKELTLFYRAIGMHFWEQIKNLADYLIELTPNTIILLVYMKKNSRQQKQFIQKYKSSPKNIKQAVLGDILIYQDLANKIQKQVLFFNRTVEGKYIIHFLGESYTNDLCLSQKQFHKCCKISTIHDSLSQSVSNLKKSTTKGSKIDKRRRGIEGVKNLSFINSMILQFLQNPMMKQLLISLSHTELYENKQKGKTYLSVILAYISRLIKTNTRVDPRDIVFIVDTIFPNFRNFDLTLINSFIAAFSQKLKQESAILQIPNIIANQYEFSICEKVTCPKCKCVSQQLQVNQYLLPVKIPEHGQNYYQIIFVPFCLTMSNGPIKRYGFQLPKNATLRDYKKKLSEVAQLNNKNYILLEIEGNTIIKNYNHVREETKTLQQLHLRQDDNIFAFQLCTSLSVFVKNHFSFSENDNSQIEQKDLKIGDMIDCRSPERGWIFGKIVEKQIMPYTYQQNLKVTHKFNNNDSHENSYKVQKNIVAFFPSHSHKNCQQFHVKLIQRVFSEANNSMINCNMPLVIVLSSWMRPKQFQYLVYMQIQRFIAANYIFQDENNLTNYIGSTTIQKSIMRETTKMKVKKFKQYLYGKNLPYKLNFIDNCGHCLICYKFVKTLVYKGESENYCDGCSLLNDEPISWQIMINDLTVTVDWKNAWSYRKDIIKNDSSFVNLSMKKKKDNQTIQSCLQKTLSQSTELTQMLCCNIPVLAQITKVIPVLPNYLILSLQRIVQENGFKRKVRRSVLFGDQNILIQGAEYKLIGITTAKSYHSNLSYTTFIKQTRQNQKTRWLAYNGQRVQIIRKQQIDKKSTLLFFYEKVKSSQRQSPRKIHFTLMQKADKPAKNAENEKNTESKLLKTEQEIETKKCLLTQQNEQNKDQLQQQCIFDENKENTEGYNQNNHLEKVSFLKVQDYDERSQQK